MSHPPQNNPSSRVSFLQLIPSFNALRTTVFAANKSTISPLPTNSVHQRGVDTTLKEVLTVVQSGGGGVDKNAQNLRKSAPSLLIAQPEEIWTNGDDGRIQRIKKVQKYPGPILQSSDCR
jgi:hypothetical protein